MKPDIGTKVKKHAKNTEGHHPDILEFETASRVLGAESI